MKRGGYLARRTPLRSAARLETRTPLRAIKPMKRKRARRIDRETPTEKRLKAWIHDQPCVILGQWSPIGERHHCEGRIEQSHARNMTGMGRKEPNENSMAMCSRAHHEWEQHRGFFKGWGKELRRVWMSTRVAETNARFHAGVEVFG